jgi:hypothetical protein
MGFALLAGPNSCIFDIAIQHDLPIAQITSLLAPGLHDLHELNDSFIAHSSDKYSRSLVALECYK